MSGKGGAVSGLVICQDEAPRIDACLASLDFCQEIVVIDSGSTDGTKELVSARGAKLVVRPFSSWNEQKEFGRTQCSGDWVFNLDGDEVASAELRQEIPVALRGAAHSVSGFWIPFRNYFRDRWVKSCGYHPDRHLRLVRRSRARWDPSVVHDRILLSEGRIEKLQGHIDHYSFESVADFLEKSDRYARHFAALSFDQGRRAGGLTVASHAAFRFVRAYFLQAGFREGSLGFAIAGLQSFEVFQKYLRLWELGAVGHDHREADR